MDRLLIFLSSFCSLISQFIFAICMSIISENDALLLGSSSIF